MPEVLQKSIHVRVLDDLRVHPDSTCHEICARLGEKHQAVGMVLTTLRGSGLVSDGSGFKLRYDDDGFLFGVIWKDPEKPMKWSKK